MVDDFIIDLIGHERMRRAHVADIVDWMTDDEIRAYQMLYSNLDEQQTLIYEALIKQGVLLGEDGQCETSDPPISLG